MARTSRLPGFYKVTVAERRLLVSEATGASVGDMDRALQGGGLDAETADKLVENVLGTYALPYGVCLNVRVNHRDHVVPMVVEEPSVVAAASSAAKMVRAGGGFEAEVDPPLMTSQVQLTDVEDVPGAVGHPAGAQGRVSSAWPTGRSRGSCSEAAGPATWRSGSSGTDADRMLVVHVHVDCRDAMGANLVNTVAEGIADRLAGSPAARSGSAS